MFQTEDLRNKAENGNAGLSTELLLSTISQVFMHLACKTFLKTLK